MNKIYKVIWNAALQCWVAVSELGKAKGKTKSKKVLSAAALATLVSTAIVGNVKAAIEAGSGAGLAIQSQKTSAQYGAFAKADAATSTAIGYLVVAESNHALAIGSQTQAIGEKTVAIGHLSRATGTESTALGVNATAKGNGDIALGKHAVAQGGADGVTGSAALGDEAKATGAQSAAVGGKSNASGSHAVASGYNTQATGGSSSAIGDAAEASGNQATAVGVSSVAGGTASSAFGGGAKATGYYSLAAGTQANATHSGSTAVGGEAQATNEKTTAVGSSSKASESWATATGASANASGEASAAFGESATASGKKSIATGSHASASGENAIASGKNAKALASNTTAIGADANATSNAVNSTVIGRGAVVNATDATVIGPVAQAHGANATAIGRGAAANGTESTALGRGSVANGNQSTALGKGSSVTVDSGVALGDGAVANRVALDKNTIQINTQNLAATTGLSDNNNGGDANTVYAPVKLVDAPGALEAIQNTVMGNKGAVSVGDANNTRQIINVAPGSADSDAVNVAQLKAVAGAIKKYSVTSPDGSITITDPATGGDPQNFQIQMNTTAVRNAAAWKIKDNGKADSTAAEVKGGDVVDFRGTNSVKVERSGRDLTFSANTASIIGNSDGSVKSRASDAYSTTNTAPADWLVTSINVADAINKSGWQLQANGSRVGLVNPGDKVNFEAGNGVTITPTNESNGVSKLNIAAKVDNSTISYNSKGELQANTNYGWSIKTANTTAVAVPNGQAVSLNEGQYINITHNGRDLQFNAKTADVGMNTTTGATNQATATGLATNKAVADAIQASGFQLKENGTLKNVVNPGESLNFKSGQGTTVSVGTNGDVQVNANVADIKAGNNVTVTNNSGVYTINANDTNTQVTVTNATSSPITIATTQNTNGTSHYTVDVNVDGTTIKKENGVLKAIIPAVETVTLNVNTTGNNAGKVDAPKDADKGKLVTAENVAKAINESFWIAKKGTRVETNNDNATTAESNIAAGNNVTFIAGKNIALEKKGNAFIYATKDDVSFNNVTANNSVTNNLTVNPNNTAGSTFKVGGNTTVDMGGNQVHNVANGTKGTDAVNLDQLNATTATAKTEVKAGKNVSSVNESKDAKDGHTVYTIDAVDTSAHVKAAESNAAVKVEKAATTRADGNTTVTDYTVDLTDETKANITHGVNANTTVTTKGLTFNGNEGTTGIKKLGSKVDVKGGTANNVITTNATEAGITINYNGTEAAKVTHLTYKANGANAQSVNLTTGLDFTNGTQTTAEVAANGVVKFNVNTTALSNVTNNGKITVPEGNGLVTAKEVAEAINASYWKANAGGNVDGATVTDNVTTGTEVFFAAGKNLKVKHSANNFTFSTADDVSFNNVTTNNLTVKNGGNVDMGGNQVHNVANGTKGTDAVNLDQLNATTATANAGWVIKANGTNATTVKPNATVSLNNTDGNILITKNTANNNVTFNFNPNATFGVVGKDGKDGVDGSIGVNGKDGASVVINGKDGSIGLTGPKGADGKDGVSVTLKPEKGTTTVNAKDDGKEIERIKYTANGTTREVATLDDGLKFKGDSKQVINRTLGSQMNITGGADETTLTDNNIGVVYDKATDGLKVKLAKDVNLTSNGSVTIGNTTLNNNGFTITNKADPSKTVSVTDKGLNNGGNTIINVAPGVNGTDAVNLDQLNATTAIANAGWVIKANGTNATTVKPNATVSLNNTDGNILITKNKTDNNVTFNFNPNATFGVVGKDGKDGVDGSIGVNGKDGSSVVINGKDGSIGLNGKDGKNGLSIKGDQGPAGVDGKDGETKTRIVYEYADPKDPNKTIRENVATLNDGLRFTGNNGVENAHRLNTLVTIVGEGVDKAASANFTSASGNINVKADGKGTLEVQLAKNLKNIETINNGNSTITLNKDGGTTISGGDVSVDGNKVTNVKDGDVSANSKDAVNGSQLYHVMTNATAGWNLSVNNGKDKGNVKPGAQVDLNNTDGNIIISKTANNVTFNFNPNATFGVKGKDGKDGVDGSIGVNGKDGASVVINGKDGSIGLTGPKGADGKDGASANMSVQKGTTTVNTDRDGGKDVTRIVYTDKDKDGKDIKREVATLDDGLKFKGDSEQVINRTLGSQMNITGGADSTKLTDNNIGVVYDEATNGLKVKLSKDVDLGKDGSITIGGTQVTNNGLTIKNGPSVTEKGVDAGNKKVTNVADGDINATSKDAVNGSQLYQAVNNINKNVNAAKTELEEGDNVTITSRVGNNGQTIYKVSSTDNSAHVQGGSDAVSVTKAETTRKDGSTTVTDYTVDLSSKTKDDIKKGVDAHDTVTNKGLTFNADKGTTGAKKLGSQVAVNGDNKNIETVADTNGVKVKLKDDINVNSVTANTFKAGDTIVNTKGVQVAAKDDRGNNTNVVINEKGINAGNTRIQNVAAGRADTDAVNVSQLKGAVTQIGNHINKMDKNLRAGIAGAMAAGGLYHATLPGKSMVAAGAGTYKGESAVAVGYSRLSDNGKVGIKFSVNTNTRGDSGAAASVGYQW